MLSAVWVPGCLPDLCTHASVTALQFAEDNLWTGRLELSGINGPRSLPERGQM